MMQFIDFEVLAYDWLCVIIDPFNQTEKVIVNDAKELEEYYENHKSDIWVGYNIRNYDAYIFKAILIGFDPKSVSDDIIKKKKKGWQISSAFSQVQLYTYDCIDKFSSLKQLESFMGSRIKESDISFDIDRKLTKEEIEETIEYCRHDVEQTIEVFLRRKADFDAHINLLKTFDLPIHNISKTQAQLSALAIGCHKQYFGDDWEITIIDTLDIKKYKHIIEWFKSKENHDYSKSLNTMVAGIPHKFGWGGLHGAPGEITRNSNGTIIVNNEPIHRKGLIVHVDVNSFYPSIMIIYGFLTRAAANKDVYKGIYDYRLKLKAEGKKAEQAPYKIILNSTYGISKDPYNPAFDPRRANEVCINGQLLLLDLIEHLENHCELLQSNTDGLIIQIPDTDEAWDTIDDICWEWEQRTGMGLGFDIISEIYQKDVNNYLWIDADGNVERKGKYVKPLNDLDYDLPIVNKAMVEYMVNKKPVTSTIRECDKLREFQKTVRISSKYMYGQHNGQRLTDTTFRIFASLDDNDTAIYKVKDKGIGGLVPEKFADTPIHCFINNEDITKEKVPEKLDKQYYIDLAIKRLKDFGVITYE